MRLFICKIGFLLLSNAISSVVAAELVGIPISSASLPANNFTVPSYVMRYAPLLYLHSTDPYKPSDILSHIHHTTPRVKFAPIPSLPSLPALNLSNLALLNEHGGPEVYLTSNDDVAADPQPPWLFGKSPDASGKIHGATPCAVIVVKKNERDVDAFYFYFYSYDQGANIEMVLPPLDRLLQDTTGGKHFGDHVGDWEHNMVRFRDKKPTGIYFSQHSDGHALDWEDKGLSKEGERPIVFSAQGSHANYPSSGTHVHDSALLDYCDKGTQWDPILTAYFYLYHPHNDTLTPFSDPFPSTAHSPSPPYPTSWFAFAGLWGDAQYPDTDPRQKTVPYFKLKRFKSGPMGPRFKQLVRKNLQPVRGRKPLMSYAVSVYMSLYGCCLQRVNVWVVVAGCVLGLLVVGCGVRTGVRGCRRSMRGRGRGWRCNRGKSRKKLVAGEEGYELLGMEGGETGNGVAY